MREALRGACDEVVSDAPVLVCTKEINNDILTFRHVCCLARNCGSAGEFFGDNQKGRETNTVQARGKLNNRVVYKKRVRERRIERQMFTEVTRNLGRNASRLASGGWWTNMSTIPTKRDPDLHPSP